LRDLPPGSLTLGGQGVQTTVASRGGHPLPLLLRPLALPRCALFALVPMPPRRVQQLRNGTPRRPRLRGLLPADTAQQLGKEMQSLAGPYPQNQLALPLLRQRAHPRGELLLARGGITLDRVTRLGGHGQQILIDTQEVDQATQRRTQRVEAGRYRRLHRV